MEPFFRVQICLETWADALSFWCPHVCPQLLHQTELGWVKSSDEAQKEAGLSSAEPEAAAGCWVSPSHPNAAARCVRCAWDTKIRMHTANDLNNRINNHDREKWGLSGWTNWKRGEFDAFYQMLVITAFRSANLFKRNNEKDNTMCPWIISLSAFGFGLI